MNHRFSLGLLLTLLSATAFGASGALAKGLLTAGWTPAAAVIWRVGLGALALGIPGVLALRGRWHTLKRGWPSIVLFGVLAVAGCQLAFFLAVERLSVAVALLLEFCGVLLVVLWLWLRQGQRPQPLTIIGAAVAVVGLILVLDVTGSVGIDPLGVMWGLLAATGLATYFIISANERHGVPPLAVAAGGLGVGAVTLIAAAAIGLLDVNWVFQQVTLAELPVPWWLDVLVLALFCAAFAYAAGIGGSRRLGSKLASFFGLSEVLFAVVWAWLLLGEMPAPIQLLGGALVLTGVIIVRLDDRPAGATVPVPVSSGESAQPVASD